MRILIGYKPLDLVLVKGDNFVNKRSDEDIFQNEKRSS